MKISELFEKDINRNITGVVKVERVEEIFQELEEFIITKELRSHFYTFYNSYNHSLDNESQENGAWISGFFGSGKSHLIKMISYLLENKDIDGIKTIEFFEEKLKDDAILFNEIKLAINHPTDAILFNIESKSSSQDRASKTAIVDILLKVFNDHLGFCGDIPWLADIERYLVDKGSYENFKESYKKITNENWEVGRKNIYFTRDSFIAAITKACPQISVESAASLFDNAEKNFKLTVEKFACLINNYLKDKGKNHRIVFLVDEMGQYVGDNSQLMLNLQTVAEDLGIHCKGKAWIIVNSQEAIDSLTKHSLKDQDFSKIQGRFSTRLNLSSSNTDEVIKKRLLQKNSCAKDMLAVNFSDSCASLKNLMSFSPHTAGMKGYLSQDEFVETYPFVPYQFNLLQKVFENIRKFSHAGKHLSEGERSMLNAFHTAAKKFGCEEVGILIPFQTFFDTVETFLDSSIKKIFDKAKEEPDLEPFDVEVLKVLFMIKYLKEVPADIENIATLMIGKIEEDKLALRNSIDASLARLKKQALISQNVDRYDFLTDEEQDVERGIRGIKLDFCTDVTNYLGKKIFDDIYPDKAFNFNKNNTYNFSRYVDKIPISKLGEDISIMIVTPENDELRYDNDLKLGSSEEGLLIIKLPEDKNCLDEIELILKTEQYLKGKSDIKLSEAVKKVISFKQGEIEDRKDKLRELLEETIKNSIFYAAGNILKVEGNQAKARIECALKTVVQNTYHKLALVNKIIKNESEIQAILKGTEQLSFANDNAEAVEDMREFFTQKSNFHLTVTMKELRDRYSKKPYGWNLHSIAGVAASLLVAGEIKMEFEGETIEPQEKKIVEFLIKEKQSDRVIMQQKKKVDAPLVDSGRELGKILFGCYDLSEDGDELASRLRSEFFSNEIKSLEDLMDYYNQNNAYPGRTIIEKGINLFKEALKKQDSNLFLTSLEKKKLDFHAWKSDSEPVKEFFKDKKKEIFDRALDCISRFENHEYFLTDDEVVAQNIKELETIVNNPTPYGLIKYIPEKENSFNKRYSAILAEKKENVRQAVESDFEVIKSELGKYSIEEDISENIKKPFPDLLNKIDEATDFNVIVFKENSCNFKNQGLQKINQWLQQNLKVEEKPKSEPTKKEIVKISTLKVADTQKTLETEQDVRRYVDALEGTLLSTILDNKIIILSE